MAPIILFFIALTLTTFHYRKYRARGVELFLSYLLLFNVGIMGIINFLVHTLLATDTAALIGWPAGSPFQYEIAAANLAFGVIGILAFWYRGLFWLATVIGQCVFLFGAFVVHMHDYAKHGNVAPANFGAFVWTNDFLFPILYLLLLISYMKRRKNHIYID